MRRVTRPGESRTAQPRGRGLGRWPGGSAVAGAVPAAAARVAVLAPVEIAPVRVLGQDAVTALGPAVVADPLDHGGLDGRLLHAALVARRLGHEGAGILQGRPELLAG